jgi:hypothetical protein
MIIERQYLKDSLYDWVDAVVKDNGRTDEVTWRYDNGPRPAAPFISIEIVGGSRPGHPWKGKVKPNNPDDPNDLGKQIIMQPGKKTLAMYGFGEGSYDLLETIRDSVALDKYINMLAQKGLVIEQAMDVTGMPAEMDGVMEYQPHFDFVVVFNRVFTDKPGWIEHVVITPDGLPIGPIEN